MTSTLLARQELGKELETLRQRVAELEALQAKRKRMNATIREKNEMFSSYIKGSPIYTYIKEVTPTKSRVLIASENFQDMIGVSGSKMVGLTMEELYPAEFAAKITADDWAVVSNGKVIKVDEDFNGRNYTTIKFPITNGGKKLLAGYTIDITERKQAEEALRIKNLVFDASIAANSIADINGVIIEANDTFLRYWGYPGKDEVVGKPLPHFFKDPNEVVAVLTALNEQGHWDGEFIAKRKDGSTFIAHGLATTVLDDSHKVIAYQSAITDITERKRIEEQLRTKESAITSSINAIAHGDMQSNITYVNPSFLKMWGYEKAEEVMGRPVAGFWQTPEKVEEIVKAMQVKGIWQGELIAKRKDGSNFDVLLSSNIVTGETGNPICMSAAFIDITERKGIEEKIKLAADEWRKTFDSITDLVSIQDKDCRMVKVNKAYADAFKKKPQELLGRTCYKLVHGTDRPIQNCPHQRTIQSGKPSREEFFEPNLGIFLEVNTSPIFDAEGKVVASVHIARDISVRKQMEQQLVLNGRLASVGELAAGVAHEINNPLTSMIGFSQLLLGREIPDDIREDLSLIHSEAQRASVIVKNLLTFARQRPPEKQLVKIESAIEDILRLRAYEQKINNIEIVRRFAPDLPEIIADYPQMAQVFLNIILNAEFFMIEAHKKGSLTITTEKLDGMVRISLADDGPGISSENLSRLFNPFFTTKEVGKGTGLGLSICHGIVTEHGGRIYVESQVGTGATFIIELPVNGTEPARVVV